MKRHSISHTQEKISDRDEVASGTHGRVILFGEAKDEYEKLQQRNDLTGHMATRTLVRYFEGFANNQRLGEKMFKPQGRRRVGGEDVMIHEFKARQFRIYGVVCEFEGIRTFMGTSCDPDKKKDKANPAKLDKAAEAWRKIKNG